MGWLHGFPALAVHPRRPPHRVAVARARSSRLGGAKNGLRVTRGSDWDAFGRTACAEFSGDLHRANRSAPFSSPPPFVINHLPGTYALASKKMLHEFVANLTALQPQLFGGTLTPETFALPEQRAALERRLAARVRSTRGLAQLAQQGKTHRVRALRSADASSLAALGAALVQERVRPLLLPSLRRAFDIGLYVVVSSVRPLRVYAHDVALVRFCEAEYPQTPAQFAEASRFVVKEYTPIWELRATFGADLARCGGAAGVRAAAETAGGGLGRRRAVAADEARGRGAARRIAPGGRGAAARSASAPTSSSSSSASTFVDDARGRCSPR